MPDDLLIRSGRPMGGPVADILVRGGRIAEIRAGIAPPPGIPVEDANGELVLPGDGVCTMAAP